MQSGQLETAGGLPDAIVEGIEWPKNSGHSLVLVALRDHNVTPNFLDVFLRTSQSSDIAQSVSVLHGSNFTSYRIGTDVYRVGYIGFITKIQLLFSEYPWLIVIVAVIVCFLIAALFRAMLRKRARVRLQGNY